MDEFRLEPGRGTAAYARPASRSTHPRCDEHGGLERVDAAAIRVETPGTVWRLKPDVELWACAACVDRHLRSNTSTASDRELLAAAMADAWTSDYRAGVMDRRLFAVAETRPDAAPAYCPLCSSTLEAADGDEPATCPVHGPVEITVDVVEEAPAP